MVHPPTKNMTKRTTWALLLGIAATLLITALYYSVMFLVSLTPQTQHGLMMFACTMLLGYSFFGPHTWTESKNK